MREGKDPEKYGGDKSYLTVSDEMVFKHIKKLFPLCVKHKAITSSELSAFVACVVHTIARYQTDTRNEQIFEGTYEEKTAILKKFERAHNDIRILLREFYKERLLAKRLGATRNSLTFKDRLYIAAIAFQTHYTSKEIEQERIHGLTEELHANGIMDEEPSRSAIEWGLRSVSQKPGTEARLLTVAELSSGFEEDTDIALECFREIQDNTNIGEQPFYKGGIFAEFLQGDVNHMGNLYLQPPPPETRKPVEGFDFPEEVGMSKARSPAPSPPPAQQVPSAFYQDPDLQGPNSYANPGIEHVTHGLGDAILTTTTGPSSLTRIRE